MKEKEIDLLISSFKKSIAGRKIIEIAKPTGVKKIREYIERGPTASKIFSDLKSKAPINTKAAIYYNDLLRFKKLDKKYPIILVDTSYWLYYRFFALRNWYNRAYPYLAKQPNFNMEHNWLADEIFITKFQKLFIDKLY